MPVWVAAVAREVLEHRADARLPHGGDHRVRILRRSLGVLAEGAGIDEVSGVGGHVAHRSQVYVKAQIQQKGGLVQGVGPDGLQPSGSEEGLGGAELLRPEGGVVAGPDHRAPLLIYPQEQGDGGGLLEGGEQSAQLLRGAVFEVPAEEEKAPGVPLPGQLIPAGLRETDPEQLARFLLRRHGVHHGLEQLLLGGGLGLRRGLRLGGSAGLRRRGHGGLAGLLAAPLPCWRPRRCAAGQQKGQEQRPKDPPPHGFLGSRWRVPSGSWMRVLSSWASRLARTAATYS